jgi:hypothetical protein
LKGLFRHIVFLLILLFAGISATRAEGKVIFGLGGDVLVPDSDFGKSYNTGFGGSFEGHYALTPYIFLGLSTGYFSWNGKTVENTPIPAYKGAPVDLSVRVYLLQPGPGVGMYLFGRGGFFFSKIESAEGSPGSSSTDGSYAGGMGLEFPLGEGRTAIDISGRYEVIARPGSSIRNIGLRIGVTIPFSE